MIPSEFERIWLSHDGSRSGRVSMHASGVALDFNAPPTVSRTEAIQNRLRELEAELAELAKYGSDDYDEGAVLTFKGDFGGATAYSYAAIKAGGKWHLTGGAKTPSYISWDDLVQFWIKAHVRKVRKVTQTERVV